MWYLPVMKEKALERKLVLSVMDMGGLAMKFISPGLDGVPDRLVLFPHGRVAFVECKAPGEGLRPLQSKRKEQLEALGFSVYCLSGVDQIGEVLREIRGA
jgi:hypothetical protein